ncbi:DUF4832 domain-containing protein [Massilia luteola]|uniref:DUF4832 domain-containing protein n=1 Tax=Massilia luteola TaxID=3081751 RepID=UPI003CC564F8
MRRAKSHVTRGLSCWAAPFNGRNVELVFRNSATGALYRVQLAKDPRRWQAGQTVTIGKKCHRFYVRALVRTVIFRDALRRGLNFA